MNVYNMMIFQNQLLILKNYIYIDAQIKKMKQIIVQQIQETYYEKKYTESYYENKYTESLLKECFDPSINAKWF